MTTALFHKNWVLFIFSSKTVREMDCKLNSSMLWKGLLQMHHNWHEVNRTIEPADCILKLDFTHCWTYCEVVLPLLRKASSVCLNDPHYLNTVWFSWHHEISVIMIDKCVYHDISIRKTSQMAFSFGLIFWYLKIKHEGYYSTKKYLINVLKSVIFLQKICSLCIFVISCSKIKMTIALWKCQICIYVSSDMLCIQWLNIEIFHCLFTSSLHLLHQVIKQKNHNLYFL